MYLLIETDERAKEMLPLYAISAGENFTQNSVNRPQGAPFHHLFFVEKGEGIFHTPAGNVTVGAGSCLFMRKEYPVSYEARGGIFQTAWLTFDGRGVEALLSYFRAENFCRQSDEGLYPLLQDMIKAVMRKTSPEVLSGMAYNMIVTFFRRLHERQKNAAWVRATNYIEEHCGQDLSVAQIAAAAGISASLLYRLFREEGSSPVDYLCRMRLSRAKRLLAENKQMLISDVAALCGFANCAYFCKVFREREHMTPKAYRAVYGI